MSRKKRSEPELLTPQNTAFMAHWQPLINMATLVEPPHLRRAILRWINENQNCAYTVKNGSCSFDCTNCQNDVTIERIIIIPESGKLSLKKEKKNAKKNLPKV